MTDIFIKKSRWFDFANEHNKKVNVNAPLLNGSKSYCLAAIHLAADKSIPLSIRLDTKREKGVADHFNGLRQFYESGIGAQSWLREIVEGCQKFANDNGLDSDEMIKKIIAWTERSGHRTEVVGQTVASQILNKPIAYPGKEDFESAYRMLTRLGEDISIDEVLDQIEINAKKEGHSLKNNWRIITEKNIEIWSKKR